MIDLNETKKYNILAHIMVRGRGSHHGDHPNRALWEICGKSSIEWVLEALKGSKYINKVVVNTESKEIKEVVEGLGVQVVQRPYHMSHSGRRDYAHGPYSRGGARPRSLQSLTSAVLDARSMFGVRYLDEVDGWVTDILVEMQANGPLITTETIDRLIEKFFDNEEAASVHAYYPIPPYMHQLNPITDGMFTVFQSAGNRQNCIPCYGHVVVAVYGIPSKLTEKGVGGNYIIVKPEEGLDMHDEEDLFLARAYMARRLEKEREENNGHQGSP